MANNGSSSTAASKQENAEAGRTAIEGAEGTPEPDGILLILCITRLPTFFLTMYRVGHADGTAPVATGVGEIGAMQSILSLTKPRTQNASSLLCDAMSLSHSGLSRQIAIPFSHTANTTAHLS